MAVVKAYMAVKHTDVLQVLKEEHLSALGPQLRRGLNFCVRSTPLWHSSNSSNDKDHSSNSSNDKDHSSNSSND